MDIFLAILLLTIGMALLIKGADWFVDGASAIAKAMKIPTLVIGLTLVSIGTSAPEFAVSLTSSIQGKIELSFGNIIGSNIFNTFVVIGVSAMIIPLVVSKHMQKYDLPILTGIYILLALFAFVISPQTILLWESIIIFVLTFIYTAFLIIRSKKDPQQEEVVIENKRKWWVNVLMIILGLAGIIFGGRLVVNNASLLAQKVGMSEGLVGLTIVAIGTSLPELVTSIVAAKKGENDIAVGNAIGSCIFNVILILGLCSIIEPYKVNLIFTGDIIDVIVMIASVAIIFLFSLKSKKIVRWQGVLMVIIYAAYLAFIIARDFNVF